MVYLLSQMLLLMLGSAAVGALAMHWFICRRYEDVTADYQRVRLERTRWHPERQQADGDVQTPAWSSDASPLRSSPWAATATPSSVPLSLISSQTEVQLRESAACDIDVASDEDEREACRNDCHAIMDAAEDVRTHTVRSDDEDADTVTRLTLVADTRDCGNGLRTPAVSQDVERLKAQLAELTMAVMALQRTENLRTADETQVVAAGNRLGSHAAGG
jgi:hypothetical protein